MTNIDKVSIALSEWAFNVAKGVLPQLQISPNSTIGHLMGAIGADPLKYSIWNELGFLMEPVIQTFVTPIVGKYMQGIPDEMVKDIAVKFADAFISEARQKGSVNLLGMEMKEDAFADLKAIILSKFEE